ncbi:MAG: o-succinylbenzoate synthase [Halorhodospira sp.]
MTVGLRRVELLYYRIDLHPGSAPVREREGVLLDWLAENGRRAVSEVCPLPGFSEEDLATCLDACRQLFAQGSEAAANRLQAALRDGGGGADPLAGLPPAARFGLEAGWLQLTQPARAIPTVQTCRLLPAEAPQRIPPLGPCLKVKVGRERIAADEQRLAYLQAALPEQTQLRLDANRSWTPAQAARICAGLDPQRIAFIEEPLRQEASYADWTSYSAIPFAWDESLRERPEANLATPGLSAVVLKPMLTGLVQTRRWIDAAHAAGRAVVLSAAFESNLTLDLYARLTVDWGLTALPGLDTFSAWPVALLTPLRSQPGHGDRPIYTRDDLTRLEPLL